MRVATSGGGERRNRRLGSILAVWVGIGRRAVSKSLVCGGWITVERVQPAGVVCRQLFAVVRIRGIRDRWIRTQAISTVEIRPADQIVEVRMSIPLRVHGIGGHVT